MMQKKNLAAIEAYLKDFDERREFTIKRSRDALKASKHAIYALHRNERKQAKELIDKAEKTLAEIKKKGGKSFSVSNVGAFNEAVQEYAEAKTYYGFLVNKKIPSHTDLKISVENYLLGLCDLTGELMRRAVQAAIKGDYEDVKEIRGIIGELYQFFMQLNLGNSELRRKSDSIKWNLNKVEDILYDISLKK